MNEEQNPELEELPDCPQHLKDQILNDSSEEVRKNTPIRNVLVCMLGVNAVVVILIVQGFLMMVFYEYPILIPVSILLLFLCELLADTFS